MPSLRRLAVPVLAGLLVLAALASTAVAQVVAPFDPPAEPWGPGHRGVDLAAHPGSPVVAALPGTVRFSGVVAGAGWVSIDHGNGLVTTYGILDPRFVAAGDRVGAGAVLGLLAPTATHLDWGARQDGGYTDPLPLLGSRRIHLVALDAPVPPLGAYVAPSVGGGPGGAGGRTGRLRWPVAGRVTSGFGVRRHPISGDVRLHAGIDIAAPTGTLVHAAATGTVVRAGWAGGYGLLVEIAHGGGVTTRYAHLSRVAVTAGQAVAAGAIIGAVGSTGASTGPHLHFEVRVGGRPVDPRPLL